MASLLLFLSLLTVSLSVTPLDYETDDHPRLSVLILTSIYPAHFFPLVALGEELVTRGHQITMLGPTLEGYESLPLLAEQKGIKFMSSSYEEYSAYDSQRQAGKHVGKTSAFLSLVYNLTIGNQNKSVNYFHSVTEQLRNISSQEYDYILCDVAILPGLIYIVTNWQTDRIMLVSSPVPLHPLSIDPWPYPTGLSSLSDNVNFIDRLKLTVLYRPMFYIGLKMASIYFNTSQLDHFLGAKYPVIFNTLFGVDWPRVTLPLQHYVGPMISPKQPPLDERITKWLQDKARDSVIYISMGTSVDVTEEIAAAVSSLTSDWYILWSTRNDLTKYNIKSDSKLYITNWVSQVTLLGHSSISLSIMQCGLTSVQESLYNGVPVVCIPGAFDQYDVALRLETQGLGTRVLASDLSHASLKQALAYASSSKVREKVVRIAKIMRASGGVKTAANLVELYASVGHDHGIPSYVKYEWYWYEYYNIDVYMTLLVVMMLLVYLLVTLCRVLCGRKARSKLKKE